MHKILTLIISIFIFLFYFQTVTLAIPNSFINLVMPVRGEEFWSDKSLTPAASFQKYHQALQTRGLKSTWLLRYDAMLDPTIVQTLKKNNADEIGLFLEVTPKMAEASGVKYNENKKWHAAGTILLTGYSPEDRTKLIDTYFNKFREQFGYYPKSVGAWWIDGTSLTYMNQKFSVISNLMVADQYSTDQYEVWGQYWSTPFYPSKFNPTQPASNNENKTGTVTFQWAARDPYRGFGAKVEDSTFSVQANDYLLHEGLDINYFNYLLDVFTKKNVVPFGQVTIGIENDFTQVEYFDEFLRQLDSIKSRSGESQVVTMSDFTNWFKQTFPANSPTKIITTSDYLDPKLNVVWYHSPVYRAGVFQTPEGIYIRDLRSYSDTMKEPCLEKACSELHLSRTTSKALDYVTFGNQFLLDPGNVSNFNVDISSPEKVDLHYMSDLGIQKTLTFLQNDLIIDKTPRTVPGLIIESTGDRQSSVQVVGSEPNSLPKIDVKYSLLSFGVFLLTVVFLFWLPGRVITRLVGLSLNFYQDLIISTVFGIALFLLVSFVRGLLNIGYLSWGLIALALFNLKIPFLRPTFDKRIVMPMLVLILGVIVSILPVINSGLLYPYGLGFWGPNGHDAVWHLSLIESLKIGIPPENYALAGTSLSNYHYFFDLILAKLSQIPYLDPLSLYFRLWPVFISLLLGGSVWLLSSRLKLNTLGTTVLIFMTFLAGSWGWIFTAINKREIAGESLFWANQAVSLHLNPPFALSLVIVVVVMLLLLESTRKIASLILISILIALLWGIKAYAGVLLLLGLIFIGLFNYLKNKDLYYLKVASISTLFSAAIFLLITSKSANLFEFSPLWLVENMIGSDDRLGLRRLATMRDTYIDENQALKLYFINSVVLILFLVGNLGARVLALPLVLKHIFTNSILQLMAFIVIVGFTLSLLFVQIGNNWNIVQFSYYSLFFANVFTALVINNLSQERKYKFIKIGLYISLIVIFLGSLTTLGTIKEYYPKAAHSAINSEELEALNLLKNQPAGTLLTIPFNIEGVQEFKNPVPLHFYVTSSYVSAFTNKPTFISDEMNLQIMNADYKRRLYAATEYFKDPGSEWGNNFLKENNIRYLYLTKHQQFKEQGTNLEKLLENNDVKIFKVY